MRSLRGLDFHEDVRDKVYIYFSTSELHAKGNRLSI